MDKTKRLNNEIPELNNLKVIAEILEKKEYKSENCSVRDWNSYRDNNKKELTDFLYVADLDNNINKYKGLINYNMNRDLLGIQEYSNGDIYLGEWKNNQRNGHGVYLHNRPQKKGRVDIEIYLGKWVDDKPEEEGVYVWLEESEKNDDILESNFQAFAGELDDANFKRGIYLTLLKKKFYIYYGKFDQGLKSDDQCYFYDNDFTIDRVFRGSIKNDQIQEGFFVSFHQDDIDDTTYFKFKDGKPEEAKTREKLDPKIVKTIDNECLNFREILYEDDWFGLVYEKAKEAYKLIKTFKTEDFNNEKKFNEIVKVAGCYKDITVYPHLCVRMAQN